MKDIKTPSIEERIKKVAQTILEEYLEPGEAFDLLTKEFKLDWNKNNEVQWAVNETLNTITKILEYEDITKESWKKLESRMRETYNIETQISEKENDIK